MLKRAVTTRELLSNNYEKMAFEGSWKDSLGEPARSGAWLIWGNSFNGKTRFAIKLAKYLTNFGKVAYNSLEEGIGQSLQNAWMEERMEEVGNSIVVLNRERLPELTTRLKKRRSPDIVIIDSLQYMSINFSQYTKLIEHFSNKLFVFISHAEGRMPEGRVAKKVRYDAFIKIWVEGYVAHPMGRYGGGEPMVVWEEGAKKFLKTQEHEDKNDT